MTKKTWTIQNIEFKIKGLESLLFLHSLVKKNCYEISSDIFRHLKIYEN